MRTKARRRSISASRRPCRAEPILFSKDRFGGVTFPMPSYYFLVRADRVPEIDYASAYMWARRAFRYVPLPVVRRLSPVLVRYLN